MSTDPAVEAARKAWEQSSPLRPFDPEESPEYWMVLAAREALKSSRLRTALNDLVAHGDLTPSGRIVLQRIIGGAA
ncbi:hypothetical protein [Gordonia westfalica]|uniref:Uncharacterized protein n=1 Tax=Gordonia westfalica TaxID=158898 RepID=A0A1H2DLY4_9ACTN|nr:hypothetical protein [Gordonia westfalica]SDT83714.1 hypothetical protein SAMN04488548_10134 [Gordonia westfalica]SDT83717.1 hypothetical protein SAMN04488548_10137 [Gordonia westfalica]SDT83872.1 hypothetical protein SAMN04488548_10511 [Gordonia westfalica]SDT83922.1 hypothetical protein SAMN04488548_10527 [Gordonia westfalica]SDT83981.1 hypothetical protein SAMN04488548_10547 [Gordonia westfalica]